MIKFTVVLFTALITAGNSLAHAFLDHAEPAVGSRLKIAPAEVRAWFTERLEPAFCRLQIFNRDGQEVDRRDVHADREVVLVVSLPPLPPGKYKVIWKAVSMDTHVTNGTFGFEVIPQ